MDKSPMDKTKRSRRNFLVAVGAGSAATVAAVAARTVAPVTAELSKTAEAKSSGYKVTEHIRNYYRTTLV
ncbi:MAG: formate dehydrogenase [Burkholderiales bacterium]